MSDSKNREWILAARPTGNLTGNEFRNLAKSKFCVNLVAAKSRWATKCVALAPPRAAAMGAGRRPAGPRASPTSSVTTVSPAVFDAEKVSGAVTDRKALSRAIAALGAGDVLLVTRQQSWCGVQIALRMPGLTRRRPTDD